MGKKLWSNYLFYSCTPAANMLQDLTRSLEYSSLKTIIFAIFLHSKQFPHIWSWNWLWHWIPHTWKPIWMHLFRIPTLLSHGDRWINTFHSGDGGHLGFSQFKGLSSHLSAGHTADSSSASLFTPEKLVCTKLTRFAFSPLNRVIFSKSA